MRSLPLPTADTKQMTTTEQSASPEPVFSPFHIITGRPLATDDLPHQTVSKKVGLAVFASDALSSTAYATEEILVHLAVAGTGLAILGVSLPIALAIAILLVIVTVSYRQTIYAYPRGGGAYIVARDNLGEVAAQIAGAALLTDYILTVAVSISSGVAQIASAFPLLLPYRMPIALAVIGLMTVVNLRGVRESGVIFSIPTYFFLGAMFITLGVGAYRFFTGTLPTVTDVAAMHRDVVEPLGWFLILQSFSSGCTALTGIEAISNGITAFKEPRSKNAASTLIVMSSVLIVLFLGITALAQQIHALPSETETIISQLARTVLGQGSIPYLMVMVGTTLILLMAANTSYADFPRLAALHAGDGFLPRQLTFLGSRLVFSTGILALWLFSSLLVLISNASVTSLIPLYAIGVFLSFTMSQSGMVVRLWKSSKLKPGESLKSLETEITHNPHWWYQIAISGVGALVCFVVMIVFAVTKFALGAWFIVVLIPTLVFLFFRVHHHYQNVRRQLSLLKRDPITGEPVIGYDGEILLRQYSTRPYKNVKVIILVDRIHAGTVKLVKFAQSLNCEWEAIHIAISPKTAEEEIPKWKERIRVGELHALPSPYRDLVHDIEAEIKRRLDEDPTLFLHIIMGQLVMDTVPEQMLHQNSALIFNLSLARLERVAVTMIPYQVHTVHKTHHENGADIATDRLWAE